MSRFVFACWRNMPGIVGHPCPLQRVGRPPLGQKSYFDAKTAPSQQLQVACFFGSIVRSRGNSRPSSFATRIPIRTLEPSLQGTRQPPR